MFSSVLASALSNWTTCAVGPGTKSSWLPRTALVPDVSVRSLRQRLTGEVRSWQKRTLNNIYSRQVKKKFLHNGIIFEKGFWITLRKYSRSHVRRSTKNVN